MNYLGLLLVLFSLLVTSTAVAQGTTSETGNTADTKPQSGDDADIELTLKLAVAPPTENLPVRIWMTGTIKNNSDKVLNISPLPGSDVSVLAEHQWPMKLVSRTPDPSEEIQVAANSTETVFQLNLSEIIGQRTDEVPKAESNWSWDWQGPDIPHPHPPVSPLFQRFGTAQNTQPDVTFWFELQHNGKTWKSNDLTIDVQSMVGAKDREEDDGPVPIQVTSDEHCSNELELEIAVHPAELGVPAKVSLDGYVTNKGSESIEVVDFSTGNDIAVYCNTSSDTDPPALLSRTDSLYPNSWILQKKEKDDPAASLHSIQPGERARVFSVPIDELYVESKWQWHWRARSRPPATPLTSDVSIWFALNGKPNSARSNIVNLKIHRPIEDSPKTAPELNESSNTDRVDNQVTLTTDQSRIWEIHQVESGYLATTEVNLATVVSFPVPAELHALFDPLFHLSGESAEPPSNDAGTWNVRLVGGEETKSEVSAELKEYLNDAAQHLEKVRDRLNSIEFRIVEDISSTPPINPGSSKTQFETLKLALKDNFYQASLTETTTSAPGPTGVTSTSTDSLLEGKFRLNLALDQPEGVVKKMLFSQDNGIVKSPEQVSQPKEFSLSRKTRMENFLFDQRMTFVKPGAVSASSGSPNASWSPPQLISFDSILDDSSGTPKAVDGNDARFLLPADVRMVTLKLKTWRESK